MRLGKRAPPARSARHMPPATQEQLDEALVREHTFQVVESDVYPLPNTPVYGGVRTAIQGGFTFTTYDLLHAVGCKYCNLPMNYGDRAVSRSMEILENLDLDSEVLRFGGGIAPDIQTPLSQKIGVGMTALFAHRTMGFSWDELEAIPGQGRRFDYRGVVGTTEGIFEAKGTTDRSRQTTQVEDGRQKKDAHHDAGGTFDVEIIISTYVPNDGHGTPRILVADPPLENDRALFGDDASEGFRARHYARVFQYIGLPSTGRDFYLDSQSLLARRKRRRRTPKLAPVHELLTLLVDGERFQGQRVRQDPRRKRRGWR